MTNKWLAIKLNLGVGSSHGLIFEETFLPVGQGSPLLSLVLQLCSRELVAAKMFPHLLPHPRCHHHVHLLRAEPGADVRTPPHRSVSLFLPDCRLAPLPSLQFLIESRFPIVASGSQRFSILWSLTGCGFGNIWKQTSTASYFQLIGMEHPLTIPDILCMDHLVAIECEERDWESESVEHLVFHRREKDLKLLRFGRHRAWAEIGVASDRPIAKAD